MLERNFIYGFIIFSACLNGFGGSIIWVAHGQYISECASEENKGLFNSVFWAIYILSYCVGDLVGAFVLCYVEPSTFYACLIVIDLISAIWYSYLMKPAPTSLSDYQLMELKSGKKKSKKCKEESR